MQLRTIKTSAAALNDVAAEIRDGAYSSGRYIDLLEQALKERFKARHVVSVSSGTMALKIALDAAGVKAGDCVIVPDITFIACASVVMELGAVPIFADVDPDTLVLDELSTCTEIEAFRPRVKAVIAVRLCGEEVPEWVYGLGFPIIIDSAHSTDPLPPKAFAACYSFHPSKLLPGLEGGAVATNDPSSASKARQLRLFGFREGTRVANMLGYKGNMTNVSACLVWHALKDLDTSLERRGEIRDRYNREFGLKRRGLGYYMLRVTDPDAVCDRMPAVRHYPVPLSEMMAGVPVHQRAKRVTDSLVTIPMHEHLTDEDVDFVCSILKPYLIKDQ